MTTYFLILYVHILFYYLSNRVFTCVDMLDDSVSPSLSVLAIHCHQRKADWSFEAMNVKVEGVPQGGGGGIKLKVGGDI